MSRANAEQKKAIEHSGGVLLSAGAGSGKTFVLVQHITYLVEKLIEQNLDKDTFEKSLRKLFSQTVMMTFTKKATGEIAIRLKDNFLKLESEFKESYNPWSVALIELEKLTVTTIDGFCYKLIKQGFFLNAPETIEIMSANKAREKIYNLFQRWLTLKLESNEQSQLIELILRKENGLLNAIVSIFSDPSLRTFWKEKREKSWTKSEAFLSLVEGVDLSEFSIVFKQNIDLSGYKAHASKVWYTQFESILKEIPKELTIDSIQKLSTVFDSISRLSGPSKKDFPELQDFYEGIKSLRDFIKKYGEDFQLFNQQFDNIVLPTYNLYQEIINYIDDHYNDLPGFVFADLAYIVNLGLSDLETSKRVAETYNYFIVDEFQDTSFLQYSILQKLCLYKYDRLFAVGDLKQAIYGFRGGELKVFRTLEQNVPLNLNLSNNYRSLPNIINFNNHLFTCLFYRGLDFEGVDFSPVPVVHQNVPTELQFMEEGSLNKLVIDPIFEEDEDKTKLSNFRMNELEAIAFIKYLKDKTPWDKKETVAILYRSLGPVDNLIFKLIDEGLSFTAQVKIPFLEDPMIGIFKVLIEELLHKKIDQPNFDFSYSSFLIEKYLELLSRDISSKTDFVKNALFLFHSDYTLFGLKTAFTEFIFRLGISNSNYRNNLVTIHEFCDEFSTDLEKLWEQLNQNTDKYSFDFEYGEYPSRIVIMSAHASKGLEFDHVILGGIHTNGKGNPDRPFLGKIPGSFKWKICLEKSSEFVSPAYWFEQLLNKHKDFAESKRLFYVACTRAQKHLVWVDFKNYLETTTKVSNSWINGLRTFETILNEESLSLIEHIQKNQIELPIICTKQSDEKDQRPFFHFDSLGIDVRKDTSSLLVLSEMSVTKLSLIADCPRKFYLKNICKIDDDDLKTLEVTDSFDENILSKELKEELFSPMDEILSSDKAMNRGTFIHATLSEMIQRNMVIPRSIEDPKDLGALSWVKQEIANLSESFNFVSEEGIKFPIRGFMVSGIPDLILEPKSSADQKDQITKIWDFKTGKRKIDSEMNYWFQLYLYAHAMFEIGKTHPEQLLELTLLYVDQKEKVSKTVSFKDVESFVGDQWKKLERLNEVNLSHCSRCPYQKICQ
jgi:ATP-dependent exoDNAse (exonuclease V) beta subunit